MARVALEQALPAGWIDEVFEASRASSVRAPRRSWMPAEWTTNAKGNPSLSVAKWRFLPFTFLPAS